MPVRLFAGVELDERSRESAGAVAARLEAAGLPARFEPPSKYHLTLAFLGKVEPETVEAIVSSLSTAASASKRFSLTLDRIGAFPHERRPHIVYLGSRGISHPYRALANAVRAALAPLGFRFDQPAVPHVTLARVRGGKAHLPLLKVAPMTVAVNAVALFESLAGATTTQYEVRFRAPLTERA